MAASSPLIQLIIALFVALFLGGTPAAAEDSLIISATDTLSTCAVST